MSVSKTILDQIGFKSLYMIGAKNFVSDKNSVMFRIMKNSKQVSYIKINLNQSDLYDIEFLGRTGKPKSKLNDIYVDQLHKVIEQNTELYTSL
jgi:hypothetical protein